MDNPTVKRALISVTDKTGVADFAKALQDEFGVEIISTGGTAAALEAAGVTVRPIEDFTGFPEMMGGRVKTLHPKVHGGLLCRRSNEGDRAAAEANDIQMIDMVVVNLYKFEEAAKVEDASFRDVLEQIDIGGPSMLRSAAKSYEYVMVVSSAAMYNGILEEMRATGGKTSFEARQRGALEVFRLTSQYDNAIFNWMEGQLDGHQPFLVDRRIFLSKRLDLRYGENPHQSAAFYEANTSFPSGNPAYFLANAEQLQGKELSYNNYLDLDAAWAAVREFEDAACVIVKHLTPCGIALGKDGDIVDAYKRAHECDPISAYGGVMAFNTEVPAAIIEAIYANKQFIEAIVAPSFEAGALELLKEKPNARILATGGCNPTGSGLEYRAVEGGMLAQNVDHVAEKPADFECPTQRTPTAEEQRELVFAWLAIKNVKSNAILISKDFATVGIGAGQPNRVNSARIACEQAGEKAREAVAASDAFMPFPDSMEELAKAGVTAVIQPGGSIRDKECIEAADAAGIAMLFTGHRHFRH